MDNHAESFFDICLLSTKKKLSSYGESPDYTRPRTTYPTLALASYSTRDAKLPQVQIINIDARRRNSCPNVAQKLTIINKSASQLRIKFYFHRGMQNTQLLIAKVNNQSRKLLRVSISHRSQRKFLAPGGRPPPQQEGDPINQPAKAPQN